MQIDPLMGANVRRQHEVQPAHMVAHSASPAAANPSNQATPPADELGPWVALVRGQPEVRTERLAAVAARLVRGEPLTPLAARQTATAILNESTGVPGAPSSPRARP